MKPIAITALVIVFSTTIFADKEKEVVAAKVYCKASMDRFKNDFEANPGLGNATYSNIPKKYSGWRVTYPKRFNTKEPLKFKVKQAGVVTVITWEKVNRYLKKNGWMEVDTATFKGGEQTFTVLIFEKQLAIGEYELEADGNKYGPPRLLKKR